MGQTRSRSQGNLPRYPTTLLFQASFDPKMARIRVLQQAQALYERQNSIAVGITRQQVLSPALSVTRRPIATTASLLQQKEPEAPVEVEATPAATIEKRKHITEEIASHNATKDLLAAEETSHNITKDELAKEIANHVATRDKMSEIEASHAALVGILEAEKNNHKDAIEKLGNEEANHTATKSELQQEKVNIEAI